MTNRDLTLAPTSAHWNWSSGMERSCWNLLSPPLHLRLHSLNLPKILLFWIFLLVSPFCSFFIFSIFIFFTLSHFYPPDLLWLKQSKELTAFSMWQESDEVKVSLLRITASHLSALTTKVEVRLGKGSNFITVQITCLYIKNMALTDHLNGE